MIANVLPQPVGQVSDVSPYLHNSLCGLTLPQHWEYVCYKVRLYTLGTVESEFPEWPVLALGVEKPSLFGIWCFRLRLRCTYSDIIAPLFVYRIES